MNSNMFEVDKRLVPIRLILQAKKCFLKLFNIVKILSIRSRATLSFGWNKAEHHWPIISLWNFILKKRIIKNIHKILSYTLSFDTWLSFADLFWTAAYCTTSSVVVYPSGSLLCGNIEEFLSEKVNLFRKF